MKQTDPKTLADPPEQPPEACPLSDEDLEGAAGGLRTPAYECPYCGWTGLFLGRTDRCPGCGRPI